MRLDESKIPEGLRPLLPFAERWGISDDGERSNAVENASPRDLSELIHSIDAYEEELFDWLAGPESYRNPATDEYVALTNLTLAIDYAQVLIRRL